MSYWQAVSYLILNEIRNAKWKNLAMFIIIAYSIIFTHSEYEAFITKTEEVSLFMLDFISLVMFSVTGLCVSSLYGFGLKRDLISDRLQYWRTLPIKIDQIVWARLMLTTLTSLISVIIFYFITGLIMVKYDEIEMNLLAFILHGLSFYAVTYLLNIMYLFVEMCKSYKIYILYCWIKPFVIIAIVTGYTVLFKFSFIEKLYEEVQKAPWTIGIASVVMIVATFFLAYILIDKKLRERNIL